MTLIEHIDFLLEKKNKGSKGHANPFKRKKTLQDGPEGTTHSQKNDWKCKCSNYKCKCVGIGDSNKGQKKVVKIDKQKKAAYNRKYKAHRPYQYWRSRVRSGDEPPPQPSLKKKKKD